MTAWSGAKIAGWLRAAGFGDEDAVTGTAIALAATNGADHYTYNPTPMPHTETRGLYALRVELVGGDPAGELYDPVHSSQVLHELVTANDGRWDWHPAHVSGAALFYVPSVRMQLRLPGPHDPVRPSWGFAASVERLLAMRRAMAKVGTGRAPI